MKPKAAVIIPVTRSGWVAPQLAGAEIISVKARGLTPGRARNRGAAKAKTDILLFLDDDCVPEPGWLEANLTALADPASGAVGGQISSGTDDYWSRCHDLANFTWVQGDRRREMPLPAASLGVKREAFAKAGGFDEELPVGEDVDFCLRLNHLGWRTVYDPKIKVRHNHGRDSFKKLWQYQYRNGRLKGLIIENRFPINCWFKFLALIGRPWLYWIFVLPFAALATVVATINPFYWPGVFGGKLACQAGIYQWMLAKPKNLDLS